MTPPMTRERIDAAANFDAFALLAALDVRRQADGLSWAQVPDARWEQSHVLNAQRGGHPVSPATLTGMPRRRDTTLPARAVHAALAGRRLRVCLDLVSAPGVEFRPELGIV